MATCFFKTNLMRSITGVSMIYQRQLSFSSVTCCGHPSPGSPPCQTRHVAPTTTVTRVRMARANSRSFPPRSRTITETCGFRGPISLVSLEKLRHVIQPTNTNGEVTKNGDVKYRTKPSNTWSRGPQWFIIPVLGRKNVKPATSMFVQACEAWMPPLKNMFCKVWAPLWPFFSSTWLFRWDYTYYF